MLLLPETDVLGDRGAGMGAERGNQSGLLRVGDRSGTARAGLGGERARLGVARDVILDRREANLNGAGGDGFRHPVADRPHDSFAKILRVGFHAQSLLPA